MNEIEINYIVSKYIMFLYLSSSKDYWFRLYEDHYGIYLSNSSKYKKYIEPYTNDLDNIYKKMLFYSFFGDGTLDGYMIATENDVIEQFENNTSSYKNNFMKKVKRSIVLDSL